MPAIARLPISFVELDKTTGKPQPPISYAVGQHIPDDHVALLDATHRHAMVAVPHNEFTCPPDCPPDAHKPPEVPPAPSSPPTPSNEGGR